ncbi:MAG: S8 family serine peptidase [Acidobacteria bacterium]|nr:S8 family serine peptidase [Acidobacteriota bacterium]
MSKLIVLPPATGCLREFAARARLQKFKLLEGVGALLVDEKDADRAYLERGLGAKVYENRLLDGLSASMKAGRSSSLEPDFWHLEKINVAAWRSKGLTGKGVVVGLLDSGIQAAHPEFEGKEIHFAHFDEDGEQTDIAPRDFGNHGTHVSGLIAGKNAGVAPDATLAVAAVLTERRGQACHHAAILAGLDWLIKTDFTGKAGESGCVVINTSLQIKRFNNFLYGALALARHAPGCLMIAASGNHATANPQQPTTPGNYDLVVGVGATDKDDRVALFSQWGEVKEQGGIKKPDICAPGVEIWSSIPNNSYQKFSGTSMASPLACGVAALLLQQNPSFAHDVEGLRQALLSHTVALPEEPEKAGRGRLMLSD